MLCELVLLCVRSAAFVAFERLQSSVSSVRLHVALQMTRRSRSIVALVTLVWPFSCVLPHSMIFQITSSYAGKLTHCASVWLLPRVGSFVLLQMA